MTQALPLFEKDGAPLVSKCKVCLLRTRSTAKHHLFAKFEFEQSSHPIGGVIPACPLEQKLAPIASRGGLQYCTCIAFPVVII